VPPKGKREAPLQRSLKPPACNTLHEYLLSKELKELHHEYLITGGIPRAYISNGSITRDLYEGYVELY
jgi:hypothetical protein